MGQTLTNRLSWLQNNLTGCQRLSLRRPYLSDKRYFFSLKALLGTLKHRPQPAIICGPLVL